MEKPTKHLQKTTKPVFSYTGEEHSACGVGFIVSRKQEYSHEHLKQGLHALRCVEHRGEIFDYIKNHIFTVFGMFYV